MKSRDAALLLLVAALVGASMILPGRIAPVENGEVLASPADSENPDAKSGSHKARPRVIVVGSGISGLTTALELGRGGADVTVVDMSSVFGGHAVMSQGGVSVVDTPLQREVGIADSADMANGDFLKWGEDADPDWVRYYVDHSRTEIYEWLLDLGVRFESVLTAPGNSVDRFHQPAGRGIALVTPIYEACLAQESIRFVWNAQATKLLEKDGRVAGIEVRHLREGTQEKLNADAVVLATGGFQSNLDMVREFWPQDITFPERILAGSGRNSIGLGHRLAQSVGGELVKMDHQWNYFTGIPDPRRPDSQWGLSAANMFGILVNPDGKRFASLHNWAKEVMPPMLRQKRVTVWFIFDEATRKEFVISGTEWTDFKKVERLVLDNPDLVKKADTIEELAKKCGLPAENLKATLTRYNELVDGGRDLDFDRFGPKKTEYNNRASPKLNSPPYYAMQAWPLTRKSMGGVAIDLGCRVLDKKEKPIPGLFAVGELTGLAGINGNAALEGTFLGPCIVTGRVAARTILGTQPEKVKPLPRETSRCVDCHDVEALLETRRPGFWHFEQSHQIVLERKLNCILCHSELAPYDENRHRIDAKKLTSSCVGCHVAQE
ncbi:MAG: FAD-dependent oxidoreductase [Planctomycetota bacterium]|nr:FAD-dependent oxidoreductase [Planctomycetota bacterium]MDA1248272.1 FAD-dependent oxidoreductase [Planctomycetota bacterium]